MDVGHESRKEIYEWSDDSKSADPDFFYGSNSFEIDFEAIDANKSCRHSVEGAVITNQPTPHPESIVIKDDVTFGRKNSELLSLSDSDSSLENTSTMDTNEFVDPRAVFISSFKSRTTTSSQASVATHESPMQNMSLIQSPPVQTMERSEEFDSGRIPSSVFEISKSISPIDWSVASNESLFSIHIGNNSFSRDPIMLGELGKPVEVVKAEELILFSPRLPIRVGETERNNVETSNKYETCDLTNDCCKHDAGTGKVRKDSWNSIENSPQSNESANITNSFWFPLKKSCVWPLCYSANCSWMFCYKNPSCHFRLLCFHVKRRCCHLWWPSCSCCCSKCSWPGCSCYCSKCSWPGCSCCCSKCSWPGCSCCCFKYSCPGCSCCCSKCSWPGCSCCCSKCGWPGCSSCCSKSSWSCCSCRGCNSSSVFLLFYCTKKRCLQEEETGGSSKENSHRHLQSTSSKAHLKPVYRKYYCFSCRHCSLPRCSCCCLFSW